jgi:hypothetical protein
MAVRLVEKVFVDQMRQGGEHPLGIMGGLRCKALEFWCDG